MSFVNQKELYLETVSETVVCTQTKGNDSTVLYAKDEPGFYRVCVLMWMMVIEIQIVCCLNRKVIQGH